MRVECLEGRTLLSAGVTEFSEGFTGQPGDFVYVPADNSFWFCEQLNDKLGRFDFATHQVTEFPLPPGTLPHGVLLGPDGNIWFTGVTDKLGTINITTHEITLELAGITPGSKPDILVTDPTDSDFIWFSEQLGGRLGRFDLTTRRTTEFDLGAGPRSFPHGLVVGPDNRSLVFNLQGKDTLVMLDLSGPPIRTQADFNAHLTEFGGLPPGSLPYDPLVGPDGNIYLTLQGTNRLGRFDVASRTFEEFPTTLPGPAQGPELLSLIVGPDNQSIWFNEFLSSRIARFDLTTQTITEFHCGITPNSNPLVLRVGPDNNIWFSELALGPEQLASTDRTGAPDGNITTPSQRAGRIARLVTDEAIQFTDPNRCLVNSISNDLLGRDATAAELADFSGFLAQGRASPFQVAQAIQDSPEAAAQRIEQAYLTLLHRPADPSGLRSLSRLLQRRGRIGLVEAALLGSPEYFRRRGGGTRNGFLAALAEDLFGHPLAPTDRITVDPRGPVVLRSRGAGQGLRALARTSGLTGRMRRPDTFPATVDQALATAAPRGPQPSPRTVSLEDLGRALAAGVPRRTIALALGPHGSSGEKATNSWWRGWAWAPAKTM